MRNPGFLWMLVWCLPAWASPAASPAAEPAPGVVVERAKPGFAADRAGLRPGDVLTSWRREATSARLSTS